MSDDNKASNQWAAGGGGGSGTPDYFGAGGEIAEDVFGFLGPLIGQATDDQADQVDQETDTYVTVQSEPIPWMAIGGVALAAIVLLKVL